MHALGSYRGIRLRGSFLAAAEYSRNPSHIYLQSALCRALVLCRFLKIRNHKSRFLLPVFERRNCESKNNSFLINCMILLANDSGIDSRIVGQRNRIMNRKGIVSRFTIPPFRARYKELGLTIPNFEESTQH